MVVVVHGPGLRCKTSYELSIGEAHENVMHIRAFVLEHFLTLDDRVDIVKRAVEEWLEVVVVTRTGHGVDDLVEIQIAETFGLGIRVDVAPRAEISK